MHSFEGDLLIGGMTLRRVHGTIEEQEQADGEWHLAGQLAIDPRHARLLELKRRYRLQLSDGRAAMVVLSHLDHSASNYVLAEFQPAKQRTASAV